MQRLYTAEDRMLVGHLRQVLEDHGIPCQMRHEHLVGGAGELPVHECWPELWVRDADLARARTLLHEILHAEPAGESWRCRCGERHEAQFSHCWRCGRARPE